MIDKLFKSVLILALACGLSHAQGTTYPGAPDTFASLGRATNHVQTTLAAPVNDSTDTILSVDDATKFEVNNIITYCIGAAVPGIPCPDSGEIGWVSATTGTAPGTITLSSRNVAGSTKQTHATGDTVRCSITAPYHNFIVDAIAATQAKLDTIAGGGGGGGGYSTLEVDGAAMTQRAKANLISGAGCTLSPADNSGAGSSDVTITCPGGSGYAIQVDGVPQTATATVDFVHAAGISLTPSVSGGTLHIAVADTGSGAGNKTAFASFGAGGCAGGTPGSAMDLPVSGAPQANCKGTSIIRYGALDFTSGQGQEADIHFVLPHDWTPGSTVDLRLAYTSTTGSANSTTWTAQTLCPVLGTTVLTGAGMESLENAAGSVTTTNPVTIGSWSRSTITGLNANGCVVDGMIWIEIIRSDSSPGTASLIDVSAALSRTY